MNNSTTAQAAPDRGDAPMLHLQTLTLAHLDAIELRDEDARGVSDGWQQRALQSDAFAALDAEGRVVAVAGIDCAIHEVSPWMLCSPLVEEHAPALLAIGCRFVDELRRDGRLVFNYLPKDCPGNRAFVERLGFRFLPSPGPGPDFFYLPNV